MGLAGDNGSAAATTLPPKKEGGSAATFWAALNTPAPGDGLLGDTGGFFGDAVGVPGFSGLVGEGLNSPAGGGTAVGQKNGGGKMPLPLAAAKA